MNTYPDSGSLLSQIGELTAIELPQTHTSRLASAAFVQRKMAEFGLQHIERFDLPLDGRSTFFDVIMPMAWDVTKAKIEVVSSRMPFKDPVVADYTRHPFHVVHGSRSTKEGGELFQVLTYRQLLAGADPHKSLILLPANERPMGSILRRVLDIGAFGTISYNTTAGDDFIYWVNGNTESGHWNHTAYDREYLGFSVTPRIGRELERAAERGPGALVVRAECDGHNFVSTEPALTGVVPGVTDREIWFMAHLYEPISGDNNSGVISILNTARHFASRAGLGRYTVRVLLAQEYHGFAGLISKLDPSRCWGAWNVDAMPIVKKTGRRTILHPAVHTKVFGGNLVIGALLRALEGKIPDTLIYDFFGMFMDDCSFSDPTVGVPAIWLKYERNEFHHSSALDIDRIDPEALANCVKLMIDWVERLCFTNHKDYESDYLAYARERLKAFAAKKISKQHARDAERIVRYADVLAAELRDLGCDGAASELLASVPPADDTVHPTVPGEWFDYASTIFPKRLTAGLPNDLVRSEKKNRTMSTIYDPIAWAIAFADGKTSLADLIKIAEIESQTALSEHAVKSLVMKFAKLERLGYLDLQAKRRLSLSEFRDGLRQAGIERGDTLVIHALLSDAGLVDGTPDDILDTVLDYVGPEGNLFLPAFTNPFIFFEGVPCYNYEYQPFDAEKMDIWTGSLGIAALKRSNCVRDAHVSHTMLGFGPKAREWLSAQGAFDPPCGENSVWARLAPANAKILFLGECVESNTYLHYIETEQHLWYLGPAVVGYFDKDRRYRQGWIPLQVGGHRDFYRGRESKIWKALTDAQYPFRTAPFGLGTMTALDANQYHDTVVDIVNKRPDIFICDNPLCTFCRNQHEYL